MSEVVALERTQWFDGLDRAELERIGAVFKERRFAAQRDDRVPQLETHSEGTTVSLSPAPSTGCALARAGAVPSARDAATDRGYAPSWGCQ